MNYLTVRSHYEETIESNMASVIKTNANSIKNWMHSTIDSVEAASARVGTGDLGHTLKQLDQSARLDMSYYADTDGVMTASTEWTPPAGYDPRQRGWYKQAQESGKTIITDPYQDASSGELIITIASPVTQAGHFMGVIAGDIKITEVVNIVNGIRPTESSFAFLVANKSTIIAHPNEQLILKPLESLSKALTSKALHELSVDHDWRHVNINDRSKRLDVAPIDGTDWDLAVAVDDAEVSAGVRSIIVSSSISLVVITALVSIFMSIWLSGSFRGLMRIRDAMVDISSGEGDLTKRLQVEGRDEVSQIAAAFNGFVEKLEGVLLVIRDISDSVGTATGEISQGSQDLYARTETTASNLQEASASTEQLTSTVQHTAESTKQANALTAQASKMAVQGGAVVNDLVGTMNEIDEASKQINEIVNMVNGIAFQTNMLALNAAVEAARAGEHGRGFAVVATEVRSLAGRCAEAAQQIKDLIAASTAKAQQGSVLAKQAGASMGDIVSSIGHVVSVLEEITVATQEQSMGISQVNIAVAELDRMTQQNAAQSEEYSATAAQLRQQSSTLSEAVGNFTLTDR